MFSIEDSPVTGVMGDDKWVVDRSRGVWMQRVSSYARSSVDALQLHVDDRVFLLERERWHKPGGGYGSRIVDLGRSAAASLKSDIVSDSFRSDEDRHRVGLLAAEAVLVYGSFYDGNSDTGLNTQTVEFDDVTYSLAELAALNGSKN